MDSSGFEHPPAAAKNSSMNISTGFAAMDQKYANNNVSSAKERPWGSDF